MPKPLAALLVLGSLLVAAGCGGGEDGGSSPLDNALRYLPEDAPFAIAIDTDGGSDQLDAARDLADRLPQGDDLEKMLRGLVEQRAGGLKDIEQALGNELVVGSTDARSFLDTPSGEDRAFVGAIQVADESTLDGILDKQKPEQVGEADGAKLYEDDSGDPFAIDGDVLVIAGSRRELEQALKTRDGDDGLTEEEFDAGTEGVSKDALARVHLDVEELLESSPDAKDALRSEWVGAVETAGIALTLERGKVAIDLAVKTDPEDLTDADLPIATGPATPEVLDRARGIDISLRDPAQVLEFAQLTAKAVDPDGFGGFEAGKAQIERQLKIDLDKDLLGQLRGDLAVTIDPDGKFGARAQLKDPAAFKATLKRIEPVLPDIAAGAAGGKVGFAKPKPGRDFYAVATSDGDRIVFGVVDDQLVVSNSAAIAGSLAGAPTEAVPGAKGALVASADATRIARLALERASNDSFDFGPLLRSGATRSLDTLSGAIEATTEGLTGGFELTVEDTAKR